MSDVKRLLLRAAELVEQGWVQGGAGCAEVGGATCRCAAVAIGDASLWSEQDHRLAAVSALAAHLGLPDASNESVFAWNDAPGRTQAEVVAALRAAAEATP